MYGLSFRIEQIVFTPDVFSSYFLRFQSSFCSFSILTLLLEMTCHLPNENDSHDYENYYSDEHYLLSLEPIKMNLDSTMS